MRARLIRGGDLSRARVARLLAPGRSHIPHSSRFGVLLVGRMLAGVATSLLFSAFEAWLVAAHAAKGFDAALLGSVFSAATLYGNGLAAIVAGVVATASAGAAGGS